MLHTNRTFKIAFFLVLALVFLIGCATPAPTPAPPPTSGPTRPPAAVATKAPAASQPTTAPAASTTKRKVQIMSWWDFTTSKPLQELKKGFEAKNPDLELEYINVGGSGYADKVLTMIAGGGDMPDVMMLAMDKVPIFADRGAVLNLDKYTTAEYKNNLYPFVLQAVSYKGSVYAIPRDVTSKLMFLNKDMFAAAGVPLPKPTWTMDEFRDIAKKLTKTDANGQPVQWGFYFAKYADGIEHYLRANNGSLVSADGTKSTVNSPESLATLAFLQGMVLKDKSVPSDSQAKQFGSSQEAGFIAGKVAMVNGGISISGPLNNAKINYAIVPLPTGKKQITTAFVNTWVIPKGAKNPDLSWRLVQYLSSKDGQQIALDTGMGLPAAKGVDAATFMKAHADNHYFIEAMDYAVPFPAPLYGADYFKSVETDLALMWTGQEKLEDAVNKLAKSGSDILSGKPQ